MSAIVILGLKLPFSALWEKVGTKELPICSCPGSPATYTYCPHCGARKTTKSIKVYKSKLTGEETTYRDINSVLEYLRINDLDLYDANPRGYTDDAVYIYPTHPCCFLKISNTQPVSMDGVQHDLEEWFYDLLGDDVWASGEYGLWAFTTEDTPMDDPPTPEEEPPEPPRTLIIPLGPRNSE